MAQEQNLVLRNYLLPPGAGNPRNSEGAFIQLKDGKILFVYSHFTNGSRDEAAAYLAGRFSKDGGKTWTREDQVVIPNEGKLNVMSVSLLRLSDGRIALFYLTKNSLDDCRPVMRLSTDETLSWSEPKLCINEIGYFVLNNDRVIQTKSGRLLMPVALHKSSDGKKFNPAGKIFCYFSDDLGKSWHRSQEAKVTGNVQLQEPGVVELSNGKIFLFCRTDEGHQFISISKDDGQTWRDLEVSSIVSPLSPASIKRIPSTGDLFLVWNNNFQPQAPNGGKRTPLNTALSKDEGKTWQNIKTIESDPDGTFCYTAIEFVGENILLAYTAGNRETFPLSGIQMRRFPLRWVYSKI